MGKAVGKLFGISADIPEQKSLPPPQPEAKAPVVREEQDAASAMRKRAARTSFRFFSGGPTTTQGSGINVR